ncbi:MAG: hypothetical protein AAGC46_18630 [Solirubrobacteraceae bacterium]|nr:hypothetical protein [Patulibacter sp.]
MNPVRRLEQSALVVSMFIGSIGLWAGAPAFWLWLAGRSSKVSSSSGTSILMVLIGVPVTMVFIGKGLAKLDHRYSDRFGIPETGNRSVARWLHSMRGGGDAEQPSMLDKVVVVSVGLALIAVGIFYIFFSHGSAAKGS